MAVDNVTFLILWFIIMFVTISSGILVIMYRVGCFQCDHKIGIADFNIMEKLKHRQSGDPEQPPQQQDPSQSNSSSANRGNNQASLGRRLKLPPKKVCSVCGEEINPGDDSVDPDADSHPACRDMDASFL